MLNNNEKIKLGISSCLLGEKVRYDGGHKLDRYLRDRLGNYVEWVSVCPESECGLPIPREAMHLMEEDDSIKLVGIKTNTDHTIRMQKWIEQRIAELKKESLCGYIFKTKSPSSGMRDIKIYNKEGRIKHKKGVGLFAKAFMDSFPLIPVEDEGRLNDAGLRENFIERIFVYKRWQNNCKQTKKISALVEFHSSHKLLIMSHSHAMVSKLGGIVANADKDNINESKENYLKMLLETLMLKSTVKKNVNVLYHIIGYFKKILSAEEKTELIGIIEQYHKELVPLIVPVTIVNHYVKKYKINYLLKQHYLNPHPVELMLRNHV